MICEIEQGNSTHILWNLGHHPYQHHHHHHHPPRCCVGRESRVSDVPTLPVGGSCAGGYVGDRECSGV